MPVTLAAIEDARRRITGTAQMFDLARQLINGALVAKLEDVAAAVRLLVERNRVIAEGAGACSVACALSGQAGAGKIACVVSGGNLDAKKLCAILGGGLG